MRKINYSHHPNIMIRLLHCLLFSVLLLAASTVSAAESCMDDGNQDALNKCAAKEFKKADKELNATYQKILTEYADDHLFIAKIKAAQRAWLIFRDAEMEALFPCQEAETCYGSMYPMCYSLVIAHLTDDRIKQLKKWTESVDDGENCVGSIRVKETVK